MAQQTGRLGAYLKFESRAGALCAALFLALRNGFVSNPTAASGNNSRVHYLTADSLGGLFISRRDRARIQRGRA